ncbi:PDZK1-interacting protein 1 isoform X1 [Prionailurus bengalensis]|uniref:PDZK1-interacting protein 1 isoform X1 n=1 Tax=Prionailurus bengalensis TaxID=37029 RepID=UPI001CA9BCE1|nr:PDZK1-interacting protein 1 isoform X1 [Prionailurus bengalensis]
MCHSFPQSPALLQGRGKADTKTGEAGGLEGQTKPGLISGRHGQTPRQLQEPRYQQPERRPRSFLQPCQPSSCSFWACSRHCHPPAVSKGAHEHSHDRWKQGRWNPGRNRRKVLLDGGQLQVQRARECL